MSSIVCSRSEKLKRVLITGMSGTGKSTVIRELALRGYKAIDTDYDDLSVFVPPSDHLRSPLETGWALA